MDKYTANCELLRASTTGDLDGILRALDKGAAVNTCLPTWFRMENPEDNVSSTFGPPMSATSKHLTPLMHASREGHVRAVRLLIEEKACVHQKDKDGMRPLHFAAAAGLRDCCELLLEARADPRLVDDYDRDPYLCLPQECLGVGSEQQTWKTLLRQRGNMARALSF